MGAAQLFQAMRLHAPRAALSLDRLPVPEPGAGQILVKVRACGVCRTDLHVADGELPHPKLPLVPGHEIVGEVVSTGIRAKRYSAGTRVGIPWLGWTCGECEFCAGGRDNLCERARFTGYHPDGGVAAAPLLCAGLIGSRSYSMAGDARKLGLYGFGAAAHVLSQIARAEGRQVFAFVRPGDAAGIAFARRLGAAWAGGSDEAPPEPLDAAIIFAAVGALVPLALKAVKKGGRVICGGIHMSDIPSFPYSLLWGERRVQSVANLTRADGERFMALAAKTPLATEVKTYPLEKANEALADLREGKLQGAAVLLP